MIEFFMPMIPPSITQQEHRLGVTKKGKPYMYEQKELTNARDKLEAHLAKFVPEEKNIDGPIRLIVKWCFPIKGKHTNGEYKTSKPDTDNLQKMLKDCMTKLGYWKDDAQVASEIIEKFYSDIPGIYIRVENL